MYYRINKSRYYKFSRFFRDTYFLEIGIIQVFLNLPHSWADEQLLHVPRSTTFSRTQISQEILMS
jgi:hypothetical protein